MDAMTAILSRRSRRKFIDKPIPFEVLAEVLNAGNHAPSAGNLQNWKFLVVTKEEYKKRLPLLCHNQVCAAAPVSIVVVSEPGVCEDYFKDKAEYYTTQSCAAAIQNMLIAANNYNLGAVWIGAFDEERIRIEFDIPEGHRIEAVIALGYSNEIPPPKNHKELRGVVFFNEWNNDAVNIKVQEQDYSGFYERFAQHAKGRIDKGLSIIKSKIRKKQE